MKTKDQVNAFITLCEKCGFAYQVKDRVITITKLIEVNSPDAFTQAEFDANNILSLVPLKGGSIWGTDGGSIGGHIAMTSGEFRMNKSGDTGIRFLNALRRCGTKK